MIYVKYQSSSDRVLAKDCTKRWTDTIITKLVVFGLYEEKYTNILSMDGNEEEIRKWINENSDKVIEISKEEAEKIGQTIYPEGTEIVESYWDNDLEMIVEKTLVAGLFSVDKPLEIWTEKVEEVLEEYVDATSIDATVIEVPGF